MITKTCIKAYKQGTDILIDLYEYERPLKDDERTTIAFWMGAVEWMFPFCTFEVHNTKNGVGEKIVLGNPPEGDLF